MATSPVTLGQIVQYQPMDPNAAPIAALVIATHADGTADVRTFLGYCQGTMDVQNVQFSTGVMAGKASQLGAQPKESDE